jgi:CheY-like chemotaxis protein
MMDGSDRVEFADVHVVSANDYILTCRIGPRVVAVRLRSLLPGTEINATGDRGRLVLTRAEAVSLGLTSRRAIRQDNGDASMTTVAERNRPLPRVGRRILVVEDDLDVREALCALLENWGHDVANAAEGQTALAVAGRYMPEVVLVDLGLPDMDGCEVASRLRAGPNGARLFLVALTGFGTDHDTARIRASGFDAHLLKPAAVDELEQLLAAVPAAPLGKSAG